MWYCTALPAWWILRRDLSRGARDRTDNTDYKTKTRDERTSSGAMMGRRWMAYQASSSKPMAMGVRRTWKALTPTIAPADALPRVHPLDNRHDRHQERDGLRGSRAA